MVIINTCRIMASLREKKIPKKKTILLLIYYHALESNKNVISNKTRIILSIMVP